MNDAAHHRPRTAALLLAAAGLLAACGREATDRSPSPAPPAATNTPIDHPIVGRWTFPIDHRDGFMREFRPDGTVTVWWPDRRVAARGTFFVVGTNAVGADYENGDSDVIVFIETNLIRISHVERTGYHWRYHARRAEPGE